MNEDISVASTISSMTFITICTYLGIDYKILWLYVLLMAIDFTTWIIKWMISRSLKSSKAINWIFKKLILVLLIFSVGVTWKIMWFEDLSSLLSFAFSALAIAEFYSILANIYQIRTWEEATEFDAVSFIISSAMKYIQDKIEKYLDKQNTNDHK